MSEKLKRDERVEIRRGALAGKSATVTQDERGGRVSVFPDGGTFGASLAASSVRRTEAGR